MGRDSGPNDYRHSVVSRAVTDEYRSNWERTFGGRKRRRQVKQGRDLRRIEGDWEPDLAQTARPKEPEDG